MENMNLESRQDYIPEMVTIREASRRTGLSYNYLRDECRKGNLVCIRVGASGKTLINMDFLVEQMRTARGFFRNPDHGNEDRADNDPEG